MNINMNMQREGLAAIFYKDRKEDFYILKSVALVDYNIFTNKYTVKSGEFNNKTDRDFNRILGDASFIFNDGIKLSFIDSKKEFSVYIITDKHLDKLFEFDYRNSIYNIYHEVSERLCGVLLFKENNKLISGFNLLYYTKNILSKKDIDQMLGFDEGYYYDEKDSDEESRSIMMPISNLPISMQMILTYGDEDREANEEKINVIDVSKKKKKESSIDQTNIEGIINDINSKIIGQEKAVETLVTNIYYNQVLIDSLSNNKEIDLSELDSRKISILLDGSTGTGKTAILKDIASRLQLPIDIVNANSFSETGYVGPTITDILSRLLKQANGNLELAERGIIVLDEIDKIATPSSYEGRDIKKGVQEELLSFIGGGKYDVAVSSGFVRQSVSFDTSKITFILSGAFTNLRENKIKEQEKKFNGMGFNTTNNDAKNEYEITSQDYIDYGLMREFFGRIKVLTSTKSYSINDLKKILLESRISPLRNLEKTIRMFGYNNLVYNDEVLNKICEEAYELDTGARGLQSIVSGIQNKILMDLITQTYNLNEPIEINNNLLTEYKKDNIRTYTRKK